MNILFQTNSPRENISYMISFDFRWLFEVTTDDKSRICCAKKNIICNAHIKYTYQNRQNVNYAHELRLTSLISVCIHISII